MRVRGLVSLTVGAVLVVTVAGCGGTAEPSAGAGPACGARTTLSPRSRPRPAAGHASSTALFSCAPSTIDRPSRNANSRNAIGVASAP